MAEAEACMREALELSSATNEIALKQACLISLINVGGMPGNHVTPAEAASFLSRLNAIYAQTGRAPETSCSICIEPLVEPGGGDAARPVYALPCGHQFHRGCLFTWWRTQSNQACPLCKNDTRSI